MSFGNLPLFDIPSSTLSILTQSGFQTSNERPDHAPAFASVSQSAAAIARRKLDTVYTTRLAPLDALLGDGLRPGHVLEISGPPGSFKCRVAADVTRSFVDSGASALFIDCQNMISSSTLSDICLGAAHGNDSLREPHPPTESFTRIHYHKCHRLPDLLRVIHALPSYLASHPQVSLVAISSFSFPFSVWPDVSFSMRSDMLDRIKRVMSQMCASRNTTFVVTTQLSTKAVNDDGSSGTFESGAKGVMLPQLGPQFLPAGRSYRVLITPDTQTAGNLVLLASPTFQPGKGRKSPVEPYSLEHDAPMPS